MNFTEAQIQRYSRHILLPEIGGSGRIKLVGVWNGVCAVGAMKDIRV